jgi:hypothetical protein
MAAKVCKKSTKKGPEIPLKKANMVHRKPKKGQKNPIKGAKKSCQKGTGKRA